MRKGASSSKGNGKVAGRVFRSAAIAKRHDDTMIETEDGFKIGICRLLNIPRTLENGFTEEVCKCFEFGFPLQWQKLVHPNKEQENEHAPSHSVEYYMEKYSSDNIPFLMRYAFTENDFFSSTGDTRNTDGPDGNAGNMAASWVLYGGRTGMPEKPLTPPGGTCCGGPESDQHESMQINASEQEIVNPSISSVAVTQGTGSIYPNSKVDDSILAPSRVVTVEKESYRSRVVCGQAEEDADISHENVQSCSNEQEMVILPVDSAIVNENLNFRSSDLGEPATPKCGKALVNLDTTDPLELPTERMTAQFGDVCGSEYSTVRRLRSGKVFGTPSGGTMKRGSKRKKIQHEASSKNMLSNEGATSTADLTSHENDSSAAGIVAEDKQELHDSHSKRRGRPPKKVQKKRESQKLFWNWL